MDFITDELMRSLPSNPRSAFLTFESAAREWLEVQLDLLEDNESPATYTLKYMNAVITAARQFDIGSLAEWKFEVPQSHTSAAYRQFLSEVEICTLEIRMQRALQEKRNCVSLDPSTKAKMTHWLNQMREMVQNAQLPVEKLERLLKLINEMQLEVDLDRVPLQMIGEWWVTASGYVGQGFKKLEPAIRAAERLGRAFGLAKGEQEPKRIEGPKTKQLSAPKQRTGFDKALDDEIPF